jgi:hypothetical protein
MGGIILSISVEGSGDRQAAHEAIWEHIRELVGHYTAGDAYAAVDKYLDEAIYAGRDEGSWGVSGDRLEWYFKDFAGLCSRSAGAWRHFTRLAVAADWSAIVEIAEQHELALASQPPWNLADELARGPKFLVARDQLWSIDAEGLYGDDVTVAVEDLDAAERERHAIALQRCMCGPCWMLRPEPQFEKAMLDALGNGDTASTAAWYLARTSAASVDVLLAIVRAGATGMRALRQSLERYATRVGAAAWPALLPIVGALADGARGLALYALWESKDDRCDRDALLREVRAALVGNDEAAQAAAEIAGVAGRDDPEMIERVSAILDRGEASDELRHQAVLGLVNLHVYKSPRTPGGATRARLEREAAKQTEAGKLAKWMLASF